MRINILELSGEHLNDTGLKDFKSTKFNNVIALVGKNGSGKTRYLKAITEYLNKIDFVDILDKKIEFLPQNVIQLVDSFKGVDRDHYKAYKNLKFFEEKFSKNPKLKENIENHSKARLFYSRFQTRSSLPTAQIDNVNSNIRREVLKKVKVISQTDLKNLKSTFDTANKKNSTFQDIIDSTNDNIEVNEFSMINESALSFLQRLPHKLSYDEIDTKGDEKKFKNRVSYKRFQLLKELIYKFLLKDLDWKSRESNVDEYDDHITIKTTGYWTIDGREFIYSDLSDGERVLFSYVILLFLTSLNTNVKFKDSIIIIDEPELNLHPKAQIQLIQSLEELIKDSGQLVIATHSLSIIANLDYGSIFLVRNNQLYSPSSSVPYESIDDLMGFDEHYNKIVEFLVSTPSWAMTNFMAQCFEDPDVFETANQNDPQLEIFKSLVLANEKISVLDFGAGKGRLLERMKESEKVWSRITNYDCFDINIVNNDLLIAKGASKVINDIEVLDEGKYDLVVMVNVLHEIHIKDWAQSINKVKKSLKENGFLAIIEDVELPIGELPNELGFLILDKKEMRYLLGDKMEFISSNIEKYKNRILCGYIKSSDINKIDKNRLIDTLEILKSNSLNNIIDYRKQEEKELSLGRKFALKSNLYVNAQLAINYLKQ